MENSIFARIEQNYATQPRVFRDVSDYIRRNYISMQFLSITELAAAIGVSVGSLSRYCKEMGYAGYAAFQKEIQRVAQLELIPMREIKNSITDAMDEEEVLQKTIDLNIENLRTTYSPALDEAYRTAVQLLRASRHIYIIGLRSAYAVAYYLYFMLSDFLDNVTLLTPGTGDLYDRILHVDQRDTLVAIGFEKYTMATCDVTAFFQKHGSHIIALTDSQSSPIAIRAEVALIAKNSSTTFSYVSAMTILNALVIGTGRGNKKRTLEILEKKKELLIKNGVHYDPRRPKD